MDRFLRLSRWWWCGKVEQSEVQTYKVFIHDSYRDGKSSLLQPRLPKWRRRNKLSHITPMNRRAVKFYLANSKVLKFFIKKRGLYDAFSPALGWLLLVAKRSSKKSWRVENTKFSEIPPSPDSYRDRQRERTSYQFSSFVVNKKSVR